MLCQFRCKYYRIELNGLYEQTDKLPHTSSTPTYLKGNDILLLFAISFLWLNLENHLHSQNALIVS